MKTVHEVALNVIIYLVLITTSHANTGDARYKEIKRTSKTKPAQSRGKYHFNSNNPKSTQPIPIYRKIMPAPAPTAAMT